MPLVGPLAGLRTDFDVPGMVIGVPMRTGLVGFPELEETPDGEVNSSLFKIFTLFPHLPGATSRQLSASRAGSFPFLRYVPEMSE